MFSDLPGKLVLCTILRELERFSQVRNGVITLVLLLENAGNPDVCGNEVGIQLQSTLELRRSAVVVLLFRQCNAQMHVKVGIRRIDSQGLTKMLYSQVKFLAACVREAKLNMGLSAVGVGIEGAFKMFYGLLDAAASGKNLA